MTIPNRRPTCESLEDLIQYLVDTHEKGWVPGDEAFNNPPLVGFYSQDSEYCSVSAYIALEKKMFSKDIIAVVQQRILEKSSPRRVLK